MFDAMEMLNMEAACGAVLSGLGQALLVGSVLAALTWIVVRVSQKRVWPGLEMALWSIVLVRFILPAGPGWSGSLATLCAALAPGPPHAASDADTLPGSTPPVADSTGKGDARPVRAVATFRPGWATWGVATYATALLGLGILRILSYRRFRAAYDGLPDADADTRRLVRRVCDRLGVRRMPRVRVSADDPAPFVMGVFRPLLVLSRRQLVRPDELETVIVHEVTHLRRGDMLVRCVQCIAGLLFFFWPVVAWVNRRIDRAREYACDEWALRRGKLSPGQYARCLFEAARGRRQSRWTYTPACMAGHPSTIERRIDVILTLPKRMPRGVLGRLGITVLLVAWCGFSLAGAQEPAPGANPTYAPTEAGMKEHAQVLFARVKELPGGDINGDGEVTKEECWAYMTALVLNEPDAILQTYPWADRNQNGQLESEEAFFFGRGDYDFEDLHQKLDPGVKKAVKEGDETQKVVIKQKQATAEFATWHVILDRRAELIAQAKTLPAPDFVRKVFENDMPTLLANTTFDQYVKGIQEVKKLKDEAAKLRTSAAAAAPADQAAYEAKAADFEQKAAFVTQKLQTDVSARLKELEAQGSTEEIARYQGLLKKLQTL